MVRIYFYRFTELLQIRRINPNVKVLLGLVRKLEDQKWIHEQLGNLVKAQRFMIAIMAHLRHHNFDGLHLDFDYALGERANRAAFRDFDRFAWVSA